jgi:E3 ubiquitin-protein ligase HUWE1
MIDSLHLPCAGQPQKADELHAVVVFGAAAALPEDYNSLYVVEPEFVSELVGLVQAEVAVEEEELRTLALRALAAQLHDRTRSNTVIAAVTSGGQSGLLAMLLHKSIASILQQANVPLAPSGSGVLPAGVAAAGPSTSAQPAAAPSSSRRDSLAAAAAPPAGSVQYSVAFVDALLTVVAALVQSTSGCQAVSDAGVIAALLPLMRDMHPDHIGLVCTSLRILEAYMDLSQPASAMFRDLGGLTQMIKRCAAEVGVDPAAVEAAAAAAAAGSSGQAEAAAEVTPAAVVAGEDADVVMQSADEQQQRSAAVAAGDKSAQVPSKQVRHAANSLPLESCCQQL